MTFLKSFIWFSSAQHMFSQLIAGLVCSHSQPCMTLVHKRRWKTACVFYLHYLDVKAVLLNRAIFGKTCAMTVIEKCFLCVRDNNSKCHRSLTFTGCICFSFRSKSTLCCRVFQLSEQWKTPKMCCRRQHGSRWIVLFFFLAFSVYPKYVKKTLLFGL